MNKIIARESGLKALHIDPLSSGGSGKKLLPTIQKNLDQIKIALACDS